MFLAKGIMLSEPPEIELGAELELAYPQSPKNEVLML
jgi:hypothetical protein